MHTVYALLSVTIFQYSENNHVVEVVVVVVVVVFVVIFVFVFVFVVIWDFKNNIISIILLN